MICEYCDKEIEPIRHKDSTGGAYGDTYAVQEWEELECPECNAYPIEGQE